MVFCWVELLFIILGVVGGWIIVFINSFDELIMFIFVVFVGIEILLVKMYNYIVNIIDLLLVLVFMVFIVLILVLMVLLECFYGLDWIFFGKILWF